uniref:trinucleotide repeat-containing gene 6C protein-like isoform X3 n=1 Tax=Myxine glutinosa TaxID=7769 RepID=UPI00358DE666
MLMREKEELERRIEDEQSMDDKKKRKDEKRKKEMVIKKTIEQKPKGLDIPRGSSAPPMQPTLATSGLAASNNGGLRRGVPVNAMCSTSPAVSQPQPLQALHQQAAAAMAAALQGGRYPPREVPPRFRQHEQKQVLKRGQPFPTTTQVSGMNGGSAGESPAAVDVSCFSIASTGQSKTGREEDSNRADAEVEDAKEVWPSLQVTSDDGGYLGCNINDIDVEKDKEDKPAEGLWGCWRPQPPQPNLASNLGFQDCEKSLEVRAAEGKGTAIKIQSANGHTKESPEVASMMDISRGPGQSEGPNADNCFGEEHTFGAMEADGLIKPKVNSGGCVEEGQPGPGNQSNSREGKRREQCTMPGARQASGDGRQAAVNGVSWTWDNGASGNLGSCLPNNCVQVPETKGSDKDLPQQADGAAMDSKSSSEVQGSTSGEQQPNDSCWGNVGSSGSVGSSESGDGAGGNSSQRSGSYSVRGVRRGEPPSKPDLQKVMQSWLNRKDLDPRVLSNAGWGHTPVQQHTCWDVESPGRQRSWDNAGKDMNRHGSSGNWGGEGGSTKQQHHWGDRPRSQQTWGVSGGGWEDEKSWYNGSRHNDSLGGEHKRGAKGSVGMWDSEFGTDGQKVGSWGDSHKVTSSTGWNESSQPLQTWTGSKSVGPGWNQQHANNKGSRTDSWGDVAAPRCDPVRGWRDKDGRKETEGWTGDGPGGEGPSSGRGTLWGDSSTGRSKPSTGSWSEQCSRKSGNADGWVGSGADNVWSGSEQASQPKGGWIGGPMPTVPSDGDSASSGWEEPSSKTVQVDNGTAVWGDPNAYTSGSSTWESGGRRPRDRETSAGHSGQATTRLLRSPISSSGTDVPCRRNGWSGDDIGDNGSWNGLPSPHENGLSSWAQHPRRHSHKGTGKLPSKQDEGVNRLIRQLAEMGFPREVAEEALRGSNLNVELALGALQKADQDRRNLSGDLNGLAWGSRGRDASLDRAHFLEKNNNPGGFSHGMQQQQQRTAPPGMYFGLSPSALRGQLPFLSPQQMAPAQLLQYAAKTGSLNPLLLQPPITSPQMVFSQLAQLQLAQQRILLQQQQQQYSQQRNASLRHQHEQARNLNIQQMQQQRFSSFPQSKQHHGGGPHSHGSVPPTNLTDLQSKELPCGGLYSGYPIGSGDGVGFNESTGLSHKDKVQSRLPQWSLSPSVEGLSGLLEQSKHVGGKLDGGHFGMYGLFTDEGAGNPLADSWPSPNPSCPDRNGNGSGSPLPWPPEFRPGEPWKGLQYLEGESEPDGTGGPTEHLSERNAGLSHPPIGSAALPSSSAWSFSAFNSGQHNGYSLPGKPIDGKPMWAKEVRPSSPVSRDLWSKPHFGQQNKLPQAHPRPPPGLAGPKSSTWGAGGLMGGRWEGSDSGHFPQASTWSIDSGNSGRTSTWLVLRNLTPQIDGSTLRTLCMQHGPLITFHLNLAHGQALVCYSSRDEASKAQKSLHMCVLGNTTIVAEFASDDDINRFFAQASAATSWPPTSSLPPSAGPVRQNSSGNRLSNRQGPSTPGGGVFASRWGVQETISPWSSVESSVNQAPGAQSPPSAIWGDGGAVDRARSRLAQSPPPLNSFLPGDLLGGEAM